MYCPNCGKQASAKENFCRSCGMSLQMISQILVEHRTAAEAGKSPAEIAELAEQQLEKPIRRQLRQRLLIVAAVLPLIALQIVVWRSYGASGPMPPWLIVSAMLTGIVLRKYLLVKPPFKRQSPQATVLPPPVPTTNQLPSSGQEPLFSVTEVTTRTLEPSLYEKPKARE